MNRNRKRLLMQAFRDLDRLSLTVYGGNELLHQALESSAHDERRHRRMGQSYTGGARRYTAGVTDTARMFAVHIFTKDPSPLRDWRDAVGIRRDWALLHALRCEVEAAAKRRSPEGKRAREALKAWRRDHWAIAASFDYSAEVPKG